MYWILKADMIKVGKVIKVRLEGSEGTLQVTNFDEAGKEFLSEFNIQL